MARFFIRLHEAGHVLGANVDDVLGFDDLEMARDEAVIGAKHLLTQCIRTGRNPINDALLIVDGSGAEVERIDLLDALPLVLRDRMVAT
jgi:hypothetical protein